MAVACVAWPWLSLGALLISRSAMRRARIRPGHVMRCVIYSGDVFLVIGAVAVVLAWVFQFPHLHSMQDQAIDARRAIGGLAFLVVLFTYRLGVAYQRSLRLEQAWSTVLISQGVVGLCVVTMVCLVNENIFGLI